MHHTQYTHDAYDTRKGHTMKQEIMQFDDIMAELRTETARQLRGMIDKCTYENDIVRSMLYSQVKKAKERCDALHQYQTDQIDDVGHYARAAIHECVNGHQDRAEFILARLIDADANTSDTSAI